jgi:hypothetical protein
LYLNYRIVMSMELATNYVMYIANNVSGIAVEYITGTSNLYQIRGRHTKLASITF